MHTQDICHSLYKITHKRERKEQNCVITELYRPACPVQTLFPKRRKEKPNSACSPPQPRSRFLPAYKSRATRVTGIVVESLCATFTATAQRRKDTFGAWRTPQQQPLWQEPNAHSLAWNRSGSAAAAIISSQPIITAFRARRGWNSV